MTQQKQPNAEQLNNEILFLREANRLQGEELSLQKIETVRWHMLYEALLKQYSELMAAKVVDPPAESTL